MRLIILLASILLYFLSPNTYSYPYVLLIFGLFVISGYFSVKEQIKKKEYLSFNVLFLFSFFLTSFAYPVFIKPIGLEIYLSFLIDENVITKSTALCQLAFSSYVYGLGIKNKNKNVVQHKIVKSHPIVYLVLPILGFIFFLVGFFIVVSDGDAINFGEGWSEFMYILCIIYTIVIISFSGKKNLLYKKKKYLLIAILIPAFLLLFVIGDRGILLAISIVLISTYSFYINKIRLIYVILFSAVGIILFSLIAQIRSQGDILKNISKSEISTVDSNWEYLSDLTSITRNLYVGYEYKEKYGYYKPERILLLTLSPIPYLPSFISNFIYDVEFVDLLTTGKILTKYSYSAKRYSNYSAGLGTHCVIDVYMSWGIIGVLLLFLLLGYIVNLSYSRLYYNLYYACSYFALTAYAIYIPRSTIYVSYRLIVILILLVYILKLYSFKKIENNKYINGSC